MENKKNTCPYCGYTDCDINGTICECPNCKRTWEQSNKSQESNDQQDTNDNFATVFGKSAAGGVKEITNTYNQECKECRDRLRSETERNRTRVQEKLAKDPSYTGGRHKAVETAMKYEIENAKMGGKGDLGETRRERMKLIENGTLKGCEGHHINSVQSNPTEQSNPNNIKFYKNRKEHLEKGHNGDFRNPSSGKMVDRDKMLKDTNTRRVIKTKVTGGAAAGCIGVIEGVCLSVWAECNRNGVSLKSVKKGIKKSWKLALLYGGAAIIAYCTER